MKPIQNVLAQNSTGEILYICGKCGKKVNKEDTICPHCNARLGKIRCPFCQFTGNIEDFKDDTCPKCGRKKNIPLSINKKIKKYNSKNYFLLNYTFLLFLLLIILIILISIFIKYFEIF